MDGYNYDFGHELATASAPWWRRRLAAGWSVAVMLLVAVVTFTTIIAMDAAGVPVPGVSSTLQGE